MKKNTHKKWYRSDVKKIFFKLATNGQIYKGFLLTSTFVPKGLSAPALGLYTCIKTLKYIPGQGVRWAFSGPLVLWFIVWPTEMSVDWLDRYSAVSGLGAGSQEKRGLCWTVLNKNMWNCLFFYRKIRNVLLKGGLEQPPWTPARPAPESSCFLYLLFKATICNLDSVMISGQITGWTYFWLFQLYALLIR